MTQFARDKTRGEGAAARPHINCDGFRCPLPAVLHGLEHQYSQWGCDMEPDPLCVIQGPRRIPKQLRLQIVQSVVERNSSSTPAENRCTRFTFLNESCIWAMLRVLTACIDGYSTRERESYHRERVLVIYSEY